MNNAKFDTNQISYGNIHNFMQKSKIFYTGKYSSDYH